MKKCTRHPLERILIGNKSKNPISKEESIRKCIEVNKWRVESAYEHIAQYEKSIKKLKDKMAGVEGDIALLDANVITKAVLKRYECSPGEEQKAKKMEYARLQRRKEELRSSIWCDEKALEGVVAGQRSCQKTVERKEKELYEIRNVQAI